MKSHRHKRIERRKSPDKICKYINYISLFGWALTLASIVIIYAAKPKYFWDRNRKLANPYTWDLSLTKWYFYTMLMCLIISLIGLFINKKRLRRKSDNYSLNLVVLTIISSCCIIGYFICF